MKPTDANAKPTSAHADFSPSSSDRYLLCPAAMREEKKHPRRDSAYSLEGTFLHKCAEAVFLGGPYHRELTADQSQVVHDAVEMAVQAIGTLLPTRTVHTEFRVTLDYPREIFGTADLVAYDEHTLVIADYKFGRGVDIPPEDPQFRVYAKAAIDQLGINPQNIVIAVIQPRTCDRLKTWGCTAEELEGWCHDVLYPGIEACYAENPEYRPGTEQCRFCKASGTCPRQTRDYLALLDSAPAPTSSTQEDPGELGQLLARVEEIRNWASAVEAKALAAMNAGKTIPGFKLVRGRSNRKWKDEDEAEKFLRHRGLKEKERFTFKLIGIPAAEKVLKDKLTSTRLQTQFSALITKPEGAVTYAPASDPREAVIINPVADLPSEITIDELL